MGWGRYAESMRIDHLSPSLLRLLPTSEAVALSRRMVATAHRQRWATVPGSAHEDSEVLDGEATALTFELVAPAHDAVTREPAPHVA